MGKGLGQKGTRSEGVPGGADAPGGPPTRPITWLSTRPQPRWQFRLRRGSPLVQLLVPIDKRVEVPPVDQDPADHAAISSARTREPDDGDRSAHRQITHRPVADPEVLRRGPEVQEATSGFPIRFATCMSFVISCFFHRCALSVPVLGGCPGGPGKLQPSSEAERLAVVGPKTTLASRDSRDSRVCYIVCSFSTYSLLFQQNNNIETRETRESR
jgi:hypothetical protein